MSYRDLPRVKARHIPLTEDSIYDLLRSEEGLVVPWPRQYGGKRVRIKMLADNEPWEWENHAVLSVERVLESSKVVQNTAPGAAIPYGLQVFGVGRSQQTDAAPVVPGHPTICLLVWHTSDDYTVTISVTLGSDGMPMMAWLECSCT